MKTGIVLGLAGLLASGAGLAQGPERGGGEHRGGPPKRGEGVEKRDFFGDMLRRADTDKNGAISFVEFAAEGRVAEIPKEHQRRLFDRLDKNKDGEIRRDEVPKPKGWGRGGTDRGAKPRGPHDPDGDGRVSLEEFRQNPRIADLDPARQEELFKKLDRNGDDFLDRKDYMGHRPGRDGEEHGPRGTMNASRMVEELDADKDGAVSFEEFCAGPRMKDVNEDRAEDMFERLDRNKDGKLGTEELQMERRGPGMVPGGPGKGQRGPEARPEGPGREGRGQRPERPVKPVPGKPAS